MLQGRERIEYVSRGGKSYIYCAKRAIMWKENVLEIMRRRKGLYATRMGED